ncbi:small integral membrane protein 14-like [Teleopsis dalmanni]|uniref:small integral membrane protein 14-like n=1 Tax=Teleopsis dalmanni TaxID=139649 RepID=UPI000D32C12E|nr:small integral membrane protein 14-like [Teleopsis dalmanni]XP_037930410.1 small integral membrane protein 14-like [Teleopsis dalmanni]XP_037930411.1 small integral membrane protein 14-like [Teleopsis dalmanni]XP_037930412.1 small integral membrane protein 14-like [Teleopsis dalmanni]XP_037950119.1 small integral membrane protein 14-like [Teleopsis dalmanni]XP_037950120.1 small integral membrane protein 14-like [Teleopsis dalmanni]XP_037950121.1 small integral membrane protein 14-like [Tel
MSNGGDEFDGCECVWSHEFVMQQLLALMRRSQTNCNDVECIDVSGRLQQPAVARQDDNIVMMVMFMILAVIMYLIRPETLLKFTNTKRRTPDGDERHGDPPPPPAPPAIH